MYIYINEGLELRNTTYHTTPYMLGPVPVKQPWMIWVNTHHKSTKYYKYKQNKTVHKIVYKFWKMIWACVTYLQYQRSICVFVSGTGSVTHICGYWNCVCVSDINPGKNDLLTNWAETKWTPDCIRHFQLFFLHENCWILLKIRSCVFRNVAKGQIYKQGWKHNLHYSVEIII